MYYAGKPLNDFLGLGNVPQAGVDVPDQVTCDPNTNTCTPSFVQNTGMPSGNLVQTPSGVLYFQGEVPGAGGGAFAPFIPGYITCPDGSVQRAGMPCKVSPASPAYVPSGPAANVQASQLSTSGQPMTQTQYQAMMNAQAPNYYTSQTAPGGTAQGPVETADQSLLYQAQAAAATSGESLATALQQIVASQAATAAKAKPAKPVRAPKPVKVKPPKRGATPVSAVTPSQAIAMVGLCPPGQAMNMSTFACAPAGLPPLAPGETMSGLGELDLPSVTTIGIVLGVLWFLTRK